MAILALLPMTLHENSLQHGCDDSVGSPPYHCIRELAHVNQDGKATGG